jgi:serine/threonine-protein kinase
LRNRIEREAQAVSALLHPRIGAVYDVGDSDGLLYLVSEEPDGETLEVCLSRGAVRLPQAIAYALQLVDALGYAHDRGVVHLDVRPATVVVTSAGVKLLDFSLPSVLAVPSAALAAPAALQETQRVSADSTGATYAMFRYKAPELLRGKAADARTDLFALGALLYEMIAGKPAFDGPSDAAIVRAIVDLDPIPIGTLRKGVPTALEQLVLRCLAKNPAERWPSAHELRRELERVAAEHGAPAAGSTTRQRSRRRAIAALAIAGAAMTFAALNGGISLVPVRGLFEKDRPAIQAVAVLPLRNLSGDPEQEYFADGMTDALITELSTTRTSRVISRGSIMQYKNSRTPLSEIAHALNVDAVVDGEVLRVGDRVRITAALVDARNDRQLWAEAYERDLPDVPALQQDVARAIATTVQGRVGAAPRQQPTRQKTTRPEIYELYLKGRYSLNKITAGNAGRAVEYFERAIALDAQYAPAHSGLADAYYYMSSAYAPPREVMPKARAEATKAVELDDGLADAHTALALVSLGFDFDWEQAEAEFRKAVALNPNDAQARQWLGYYLGLRERFDEAEVELRRAHDLDPLSPAIDLYAVIMPHFYRRQFGQAARELENLLLIHHDYYPIHAHLGIAYLQLAEGPKAIAQLEHARQLDPAPWILGWLGYAYAKSGRESDSRAILHMLQERAAHEYVLPSSLAMIYLALGDKDAAFKWLETAYDVRDEQLTLLRVDPAFDPVRTDPRFDNLLRRVHLSR